MTRTQPVRRGYVDTPDGQIHYRTAGEGDPLLLLHQSPHSGSMWEPVLPLFGARGYRAIAPDTPGFGLSDLPPQQPNAEYYTARILEFASLLGIESCYILGHHTGAALGSLIAANQPENVRKLALFGYPMFDAAYRAELRKGGSPAFTNDGEFLLKFWQGRRKMSNPGITPQMSVRLLIDRLQSGELGHWGKNAVGGIDLEELPKRVLIPTLLICGQRDTAWEHSKAAAHVFPNVRFEVIEGASMDVADESPDQLVDLVDTFFREP